MPACRKYWIPVFVFLLVSIFRPLYAFDFHQDSLSGKVKFYSESYFLASYSNGLVVKGEWDASLPYNFEAEVKGNKYILKKRYYDGSGVFIHHDEYFYNEQNQLVEKHSVTADHHVFSKEFYTHDHQGRKDSEQFHHYQEKHKGRNIRYNYEYHEDTLEAMHYNHDSELMTRIIHVFNQLEQEKQKLIYNNAGELTERVDYVYNSKGQLSIETSYNSKNEVLYKQRYHYDHFGLMVLDEILDADGKMIKSSYREISYDTYGNWTQINHFENGLPVYIIQRKITYE